MSQPTIVYSLRAAVTQHRVVSTAPRSRAPLHCHFVTLRTGRRQLAVHCSSSNGANREADEAMDVLATDEDMELLTAE